MRVLGAALRKVAQRFENSQESATVPSRPLAETLLEAFPVGTLSREFPRRIRRPSERLSGKGRQGEMAHFWIRQAVLRGQFPERGTEPPPVESQLRPMKVEEHVGDYALKGTRLAFYLEVRKLTQSLRMCSGDLQEDY